MAILLCFTVGILFGISVFLLLHPNLMRMLFGIVLIGSSINLLIFTVGGLTKTAPAFIPVGQETAPLHIANPLPQALILTAIVIGFGIFTYALVLITKVWQKTDNMNVDELRIAEPASGELQRSS